MKIFVDADACPKFIKEILFRAAERAKIKLILVANQGLQVPKSDYIAAIQVPKGFDMADNYIIDNIMPGDLVISADIPLAYEVIEKQGMALNPRGLLYTKHNIKQLLIMRDFMDTLRSSGIHTGTIAELSQRDRKLFANQLDQILRKYKS